MQDRYAGDVGDFQKLGLLRALCAGGEGDDSLRLGVSWYLVPDEAHNSDGKHVAYLDSSNPQATSLRSCDPDLYERLGSIVRDGRRTVSDLEQVGALPSRALTYREPLHRGMTGPERSHWHASALAELASADLIFLDPDNGLRSTGSRYKQEKYAFAHEVADYAARDQSVVVYHHADRTPGGVPVQVQRRLSELRAATGAEPLGAIVAHRGSTRFFLIVPAPSHRARLQTGVEEFAARWGKHVSFFSSEAP